MKVTHLDAEGFLRSAGDFLAAREAEHNLLLGLAGRLRANPHTYGEADPYFAVVEDGGRVVAAALRTPPYNLILSETGDPAAYGALAKDAHDVFADLPGVSGPASAIGTFLSTREALTGERAQLVMSQGIYAATEVVAAREVGGRMREAAAPDRELLLDWLGAFMREAIPGDSPENATAFLEHNAADPDGRIVLWEDGGSVSLAACQSRTPHGIRIGPVYTPPELRRRGYASALTAELTRQLLSGGYDFCFLYTDLANPTANSIYRQIGYRPVTEVEQWRFE
ncbi:MAG TPA: GNAT family N-acetyltransferase [Gaiellaceae bacterium]|nr:GNAT family N-acetyltransferase [Gaiellaceae bacterium]